MHLYPAPTGAAVKVVLGVRDGAQPHVYATGTATPPDPHTPGTARALIGPDTALPPGNDIYTAAQYGSTVLTWYQALDLSLALGPLYYHLFDLAHPADPPVTLTVDASQPTRTAQVPLVENFLRARLVYHMFRLETEGIIDDALPIIEQDSLATRCPRSC